jgi:tetratricopeptide (TPR) repeat protein
MVLYRGNHLLGVRRFDDAIACYEKYVKESGWPEEIYVALLNMGRCFKGKATEAKDDEAPFLLLKAVSCYRDACASIPDHYEAHANLADVYLILGELDKAEYHARQALTTTSKRFIPVENPATREIMPLVILQSLCFKAQRWDEAMEWGKKAAILLPDDEPVRKMLVQTQKMLRDRQTYDAFLKVRDALRDGGEEGKLRSLMRAIPDDIADLGELARHMRKERPVGKKSLAIYCGPTVEEWSPDSLIDGIGGSEEAVIFVAYELAALGYHVEVYNMPPMAQQGDVGGVQWLPYWCYDPEDPPDIFIAWRGHDYLRLGEKASQRYLWLHDRQASLLDRETVRLADRIFVLSKSHRADYGLSEVPEDKIHYTANGLNHKWLEPVQAVPGKAVYASCPTRGLKTLLELWPEIKAKTPDGELHVYYGFSPLYEVHARQNPALITLKADILRMVDQPGVVWHGKVGQKELAHAFATSAAWLYPTEFPETFCITAIRAQASGCYPVTSGFAALAETTKEWDRGPVDEHDLITKNPARRAAFVEAAAAALTDGNMLRRQEMASWTRQRHSWAAVATDWHRTLFSAPSQSPAPSAASEPSLAANSS